jgi:hypothetical protein
VSGRLEVHYTKMVLDYRGMNLLLLRYLDCICPPRHLLLTREPLQHWVLRMHGALARRHGRHTRFAGREAGPSLVRVRIAAPYAKQQSSCILRGVPAPPLHLSHVRNSEQ